MNFSAETQSKISEIEKKLGYINQLTKRKNGIENLVLRCQLLISLCSLVEESQNLYLQYYEEYDCDIDALTLFDYQTSCYANRLYSAIDKIIIYVKHTPQILQDTEFKKYYDYLTKYHKTMCYISARWFVERQMNVWDMGKNRESNKKLPRRKPLLKDVMPCFDRLLAVKMGIKFNDNFNIKRLVVCVPPSSGKTYCANVYTNLMLSHHALKYKETGIIRMTNNADNAKNYGQQVYKMMTDPMYVNIFPEYEKFTDKQGKVKMFANESREKYLLANCSSECTDSIFMFGTDAGINGKRAMLGAILDDLSNGFDDMDNDERHKEITDKIMSDVLDRSDDDDSPIIIMGTMYNENDVQNAFIDTWTNGIGLVPHPTLKSVQVTRDGLYAVCLVDVEDENGDSIAPDLYPNSKLAEKREYYDRRGKSYVYNLIYRQRRDSREPKTFGYENLMTYDELPESVENFSRSFIDTTRKNGNDYFSQPFIQFNPVDKLYYLTDAMFEQRSIGQLADPKNEYLKKICKKIISMNTVETCIESNTSNTTGLVLKTVCKAMGYESCKFRERFTTYKGTSKNKMVRILNMEETIKNNIVFPSRKAKISKEFFQFMKQLTNWNSKGTQCKANPDDAPDSLAMLAAEFLFKKKSKGTITPFCNKSDLF